VKDFSLIGSHSYISKTFDRVKQFQLIKVLNRIRIIQQELITVLKLCKYYGLWAIRNQSSHAIATWTARQMKGWFQLSTNGEFHLLSNVGKYLPISIDTGVLVERILFNSINSGSQLWRLQTLTTISVISTLLTYSDDINQNLSSCQKELLDCYWRLGHTNFQCIQRLMAKRIESHQSVGAIFHS